MPKTRPLQQQRKRRVRISKEAPFPVPIATVTGETPSNSNWIYYTAMLSSTGVTVHHSGDMEFLYRMGFFGKGSMSRGQPQWDDCRRVAALPSGSPYTAGGWQGLLHATVTSRRRYMTHWKWHLQSAGDSATLTKAEQDQQVGLEDPAPQSDQHSSMEHGHTVDTENTEHETGKSSSKMDLEEKSLENLNDKVEVKHGSDTDWCEEDGDAEFWGTADDGDTSVTKAPGDDALASWDCAEGDAEFWMTEDTNVISPWSGCSHKDFSDCGQRCGNVMVSTVSEPVSKSPVRLEDQQNHPSHTDHQSEQTAGPLLADSTTKSVVSKNTAGIQQLQPEHDSLNCKVREHFTSKQLGDSAPKSFLAGSSPSGIENAGTSQSVVDVENSPLPSKESSLQCGTTKDTACESFAGKPSEDGTAAELNPTCPNDAIIDKACEGLPRVRSECERTPVVEWSEFCQDSGDIPALDLDGQLLLVIPDSDEEERTVSGQICRTKTKWKPVVKPEPFLVKEHLHLSSEEAFFLSYGLGCLTVMDPQKRPLSLQRLWKVFCQQQPQFLPNYIAYHYYRSKNWVPKTGLKFGCTFLLYKDGPPFYHGSYSVVVRFVDVEGNAVEGYGKQQQFSWTSLAGLKRITEHVGKELMVCYVIKPLDVTPEDMLSPACIPRFQVKEVLVSRWVSSQERENKGLEDLP